MHVCLYVCVGGRVCAFIHAEDHGGQKLVLIFLSFIPLPFSFWDSLSLSTGFSSSSRVAGQWVPWITLFLPPAPSTGVIGVYCRAYLLDGWWWSAHSLMFAHQVLCQLSLQMSPKPFTHSVIGTKSCHVAFKSHCLSSSLQLFICLLLFLMTLTYLKHAAQACAENVAGCGLSSVFFWWCFLIESCWPSTRLAVGNMGAEPLAKVASLWLPTVKLPYLSFYAIPKTLNLIQKKKYLLK